MSRSGSNPPDDLIRQSPAARRQQRRHSLIWLAIIAGMVVLRVIAVHTDHGYWHTRHVSYWHDFWIEHEEYADGLSEWPR